MSKPELSLLDSAPHSVGQPAALPPAKASTYTGGKSDPAGPCRQLCASWGEAGSTTGGPAAATPLATHQHTSTSTSAVNTTRTSGTSMGPFALSSTVSDRPLGGRIRLDVLLATGQRNCFDFRPETQVQEVREEIWKTWPDKWPARPTASSSLRLLHLGHILSDATILGPAPAASPPPPSNQDGKKSSLQIPQYRGLLPGRTTVVHLLAQGGWMSEEERTQEEQQENLKSQQGSSTFVRRLGKGAGGSAGQGAAAGTAVEDGQQGGISCCCVIC